MQTGNTYSDKKRMRLRFWSGRKGGGYKCWCKCCCWGAGIISCSVWGTRARVLLSSSGDDCGGDGNGDDKGGCSFSVDADISGEAFDGSSYWCRRELVCCCWCCCCCTGRGGRFCWSLLMSRSWIPRRSLFWSSSFMPSSEETRISASKDVANFLGWKWFLAFARSAFAAAGSYSMI